MELGLILHGALSGFSTTLLFFATLLIFAVMGFRGLSILVISLLSFLWFWLIGFPLWLLIVLFVPTLLFVLPVTRRALVTTHICRVLRKKGFLPKISATEQAAIDAGTTWVDAELFSGSPDPSVLLEQKMGELSADEQLFLDGPCEKVCELCEDWEVQKRGDLSPEVWDYLKKEGFFGMIISKEHGGLGFSASANSAVVAKLASRSMTLAITVMVPNSLGPAELLSHYGSEDQKRHYLPRLARGEEIPCFALTEPSAGSDAGSIQATGVVCRLADGKVGMRLNWNKRYITLAAVSTVLGLAFKLEDPEEMLGKGTKLGITCALIPTNSPGVDVSQRHDPMGVPFFNCPTTGKDVEVPIDAIIGGVDGAGQGWPMLMECLAAGRGISLPATAAGSAKLVARASSAHAVIRKQFGLSIGKFEGVEEPLARIAGTAYMLEAARRYTCGGLDRGEKPPVVTAIMKYYSTELARQSVNDGMDVMGGNGISRGPRNLLAGIYAGMPISITVEGANILTRTLIIFGQGAIRCHPFALKEIQSLAAADEKAFDRAFWGHVGHVLHLGCRSLLLGLTRGFVAKGAGRGRARGYWKKLQWASAESALLAELAMATLGGQLKRKEKLGGRFADLLGWQYLGVSTLKRFEDEGASKQDAELLAYCMERVLAELQKAREGILANLGLPGGAFVRAPLAWLARSNRFGGGAKDRLGSRVARGLLNDGDLRQRLTNGIYLPTAEGQSLSRLESALQRCQSADAAARRLRELRKEGKDESALSEADRETLAAAESARWDAIQVDAFPAHLGSGTGA